ncbi:MAG: hypothetical protein ACK5H4_12235 [Lacrimispora sphenoides]
MSGTTGSRTELFDFFGLSADQSILKACIKKEALEQFAPGLLCAITFNKTKILLNVMAQKV